VSALVLTYHGVERSGDPLFIEPELFRTHLDCIVDSGVSVLTITELARRLRSDDLHGRAAAITFDDGLASVMLDAAPLLQERGLTATVFCVGGYLGRTNEWPSRRLGTPVRDLASEGDLAQLAGAGWEIGSHTMEHVPLIGSDTRELHHEIVHSKHVLEQAIGVSVRSFAYPYGAGPTRSAVELVGKTYQAGCSTRLRYVKSHADTSLIPRVDAHYLRRPHVLRSALDGSLEKHLAVRDALSRVRRRIRADYDLSRTVVDPNR
jgi:peptidoglycan/xylan/chitin deacetylase (PgdA/CDA1 family)